MQEKQITLDFIKLFLINCAVKMTKDKLKSSGSSLIIILEKLNFKQLLDNNILYLMAYQYADLKFDDNQFKKIDSFLSSIIKTDDIDKEFKKIYTDNKILEVLTIATPFIKKSVSALSKVLEKLQFIPENTNNLLNQTIPLFKNINLIDKLTDSINIKEILNQKIIISSLEERSLLREIILTLKSKVTKIPEIHKQNYNNIILWELKASEDFYKHNINIEFENNKIYGKSLEILNDYKIKESQLPFLMSTFEAINREFNLKKNMELKFEYNFVKYYSIELYLSVLKENKVNKNNDIILSDIKFKLREWFSLHNKKEFFCTLLYRCVQSDYIDEMFSLIQNYGDIHNIEEIPKLFICSTVHQNKKILIEYIHEYYQINENNLQQLKTSSIINESAINAKQAISNKIINGLSKYSYNNDLLNTYAEMEVV